MLKTKILLGNLLYLGLFEGYPQSFSYMITDEPICMPELITDALKKGSKIFV